MEDLEYDGQKVLTEIHSCCEFETKSGEPEARRQGMAYRGCQTDTK